MRTQQGPQCDYNGSSDCSDLALCFWIMIDFIITHPVLKNYGGSSCEWNSRWQIWWHRGFSVAWAVHWQTDEVVCEGRGSLVTWAARTRPRVCRRHKNRFFFKKKEKADRRVSSDWRLLRVEMWWPQEGCVSCAPCTWVLQQHHQKYKLRRKEILRTQSWWECWFVGSAAGC